MAEPGDITVEGCINGRQVEMVVDTGARRTYVREGVLPASKVRCVSQQLCGVTGNCMPAKGPVWVNLTIGVVTERIPAFVAAIEEECLLGLDYLVQVEACLDLRESKMSVRGYEVPVNLTGGLANGQVVTSRGRREGATEAQCQGRALRAAAADVAHPDTPAPRHPATTTNQNKGCEMKPPNVVKKREALPEYLEDLFKRSTTQVAGQVLSRRPA